MRSEIIPTKNFISYSKCKFENNKHSGNPVESFFRNEMHLMFFRRFLSQDSNFVVKNIIPKKKAVERMSKKPFTIIVEGNIGSGKTTFLKNFENNKNILTLLEPVNAWKNIDGHDLLSLMYQDIKSWAFTFQTYVQVTMMKLHEQKTDKPVKIMERSLFSGRYVFIENLFNMGILLPAEVAVLDEWFKWLVDKDDFSVDLIVYLRCEPEVAYERIRKRCRTGEDMLSLDYVKKVHEYHEDWLCHHTKFSCSAPVLILDANKDLNDIKEEYSHFQSHLDLISSQKLP